MTPFVTALMLGIGSSVWIYNKLMRNTGGNAKNSAIAAGALGFVAFLFMWMIMSMLV
jgi:hypothetical protein